MALLAGGVAALGGRLLHTAKKPARNSSEVQQQMVRGSWLHKKDISQEHFRGAAAHVCVCVCADREGYSNSVTEVGRVLGWEPESADQHQILHGPAYDYA